MQCERAKKENYKPRKLPPQAGLIYAYFSSPEQYNFPQNNNKEMKPIKNSKQTLKYTEEIQNMTYSCSALWQ